MNLNDKLRKMYRNRKRSRFVGSAGGISFVAGAAIAGQCMIWLGMFKPGITPNSEIVDYWPGFLIGGIFFGFFAAIAASIFYDAYLEND